MENVISATVRGILYRDRLRPPAGAIPAGYSPFPELVLHPQPAVLLLQLLHPSTLDGGQLGLALEIGIAPRFHPISQRPVIDAQRPGMNRSSQSRGPVQDP